MLGFISYPSSEWCALNSGPSRRSTTTDFSIKNMLSWRQDQLNMHGLSKKKWQRGDERVGPADRGNLDSAAKWRQFVSPPDPKETQFEANSSETKTRLPLSIASSLLFLVRPHPGD